MNHQYRAYDPLTDYRGPIRDTVAAADRDAQRYVGRLVRQDANAISGIVVVHDDGDGYAEDEDGQTVWPPHGMGHGAVRFRGRHES